MTRNLARPASIRVLCKEPECSAVALGQRSFVECCRISQFFQKRLSAVKNRITLALVALLIVALTVPVFVSAQQQRQQSQASEPSAAGKTNGTTGRRNTRPPRVSGEATSAVEQDFAEALSVIQDNYIDGNKLEYNNV